MFIRPIANSNLMVAATTYIDEFSMPMKNIQTKIVAETTLSSKQVNDSLS